MAENEVNGASQLVIDPIGRNLIWLDSINGRIELLNLRFVIRKNSYQTKEIYLEN